ncbi:interferon-induced transmembrane protein 2-like, partial [Equus quagga]|uniref:interferon-induced transmembrane protein 2-like n=1 Tax=Equus quagga TaxID=89248 RepID=UPI001EE2BF86
MLKEEHEASMLGVPQSSAPVMTTVINIRSETSVPEHIFWSLFNTLFTYWCCCLGFMAFIYSMKSRDWKMVGDVTWAQNYASMGKFLNICALVMGFIVTTFFIMSCLWLTDLFPCILVII